MFRNIFLKLRPFHQYRRKADVNRLFYKSQLCYSSDFCCSRSNPIFQCCKSVDLLAIRSFTSDSNPKTDVAVPSSQSSEVKTAEDLRTAKISIFKRVVLTIQSYGIVMVVMVIVQGGMWFSLCLFAAYKGLNILPLLKWLYSPQWIIDGLSKPGVGEVATAYLFYKILIPVRYFLIYRSTTIVTRKLQDLGYLARVKEEDRLRNLAKEGGQLSKQILKEKRNQSAKILKDQFEKKWKKK